MIRTVCRPISGLTKCRTKEIYRVSGVVTPRNITVAQERATFSERGPDETFRSSSWAGVTNENPKMRMYMYI